MRTRSIFAQFFPKKDKLNLSNELVVHSKNEYLMQHLVEKHFINKKPNRIINSKKKCIKSVINAFITDSAIIKYALLMHKKCETSLCLVHWIGAISFKIYINRLCHFLRTSW